MTKTTHYLEEKRKRGFTLMELLVTLAVVGFLAVTLLPALAATKSNSKLIQCQSNLRQIGAACAMYADDFNGWYPITSVGSVNNYSLGTVNRIQGIHYTRYIYQNDTGIDGEIMPRYLKPSNSSQKGFQDQNLGYLYVEGLIADGHTFFCPSYDDVTDPRSQLYYLGAKFYSNPQFMSTHGGGSIRSSYMFNPRLINPNAGDNARMYQKAGDVHQRDIFTVDFLGAQGVANPVNPGSQNGCPFTPENWAHWPGKGLNVLFTDGSAKFCTITNSGFFNGVVKYLIGTESTQSLVQYNAIFNVLRDSP